VTGTHGFQVSYSGSGVVKAMNFSDVGTALILPRSGGGADLSGHATITTTDGEKGNYTFYSRQSRKWYDHRLGMEIMKK
jgi:hypothetical protein